MRVKITKLMPFTEANKKYQTQTMVVDNQPYYISHTSIDKKGEHYVGLPFIVHLHGAMPNPNLDKTLTKQTVTDAEFKDLMEFLKALDEEGTLSEPELP